MKFQVKTVITAIFTLFGFYIGNSIFISKTEQILSWLFVVVTAVVFWRKKYQRVYFFISFFLIITAVVLYLIGSTTIRYIHYVDKASLWSFYFFVTGVFFALIDVFLLKERKRRK